MTTSTVDEAVRPIPAFRTVERSLPFTFTRAEDDDSDGLTLEGYAAVFDEPTRIDSWEGVFDEQIRRGAFRKTLQERTPVLQFEHGRHPLIGSIPIGVIEDIREDDRGVPLRGRLTDNWLIQPIRDAIRDRAVDGMSFRFEVVREIWRDKNGKLVKDENELRQLLFRPGDRGPLQRTLVEIKVPELGPVVFPAYVGTTSDVRSRELASTIASDQELTRAIRSSLASSQMERIGDMLDRVEHREAIEALGDEETCHEVACVLLFGADDERIVAPSHNTSTVEGTWSASTHVGRLPSPMPVATARRMYAWYDGDRVENGQIVKDACSLPHHETSANGRPGAANLNGVRNALARLPQSNIPQTEQDRVRAHLRNHLPDGEEDNEASSEPAASHREEHPADEGVQRSDDAPLDEHPSAETDAPPTVGHPSMSRSRMTAELARLNGRIDVAQRYIDNSQRRSAHDE